MAWGFILKHYYVNADNRLWKASIYSHKEGCIDISSVRSPHSMLQLYRPLYETSRDTNRGESNSIFAG